ncbi:MFS transporter [Cryptosporangium arvum]|uniref:MFS transporter,sugar transporter family protein n=1 Tax=Cryptosporangium arvum DSM 44712 TaxID=927661 RepID=A0A010ZSZ6_9ACTN|nr:MFS transporter [Cryptosporangium arvum]EXG81804.1 MFS transporter,sugar transporter family protein [Cryptosporangium arvum DSM 44712]
MSETPIAQPRKAALAAWIGSALEYYDFFIYGTAAALVFNKVFFPDSDPATGTLLALATFGVGYAARPIGAFILGHIGDKFGRKRVLVFTLMLMGVSTFLVGCLPTYAQVGVLAPTLLVVLRLAQGFSAAGEQASANSMTLEHAPEGRRGFFTSFTLNGTQMGQILATAAFLPVAALPESALLSWGWRIPFLLSVLVMLVGYLIRRRMEETPAFVQEDSAKMPLAILFRDHWASVLRVILVAMVASVSTIFGVYALSFGTDTAGLERSTLLWVGVLANVVALGAIPLWASLADRIGRKPVMIGGTLGSAALMFAYLSAIGHGNWVLIFAIGILLSGVVYSAPNSTWPAFYGEMFTTRVRLSGMAIGTQIGFAIGGFAPTIGAAVSGDGRSGWLPVAVMLAVLCVISAVATATARETAHVPTADLGRTAHPSPTQIPAPA